MSGEINSSKMATSNIRIKKVCEWFGKGFEAQNVPPVSVASDVRNTSTKIDIGNSANRRRKQTLLKPDSVKKKRP